MRARAAKTAEQNVAPIHPGRRPTAPSAAVRRSYLMLVMALAPACTVQLTAPYSSEIDAKVSALQDEFAVFTANMQMIADSTEAYYDKQKGRYAEFEARLAVIKDRSESLSGGVPCGRALSQASKLGIPITAEIQQRVSGEIADAATSGASCITILASLAGRNMELLRQQHAIRCNPSARPALCTTLFGSPPVFEVFNMGPNQAPLVNAVAITLRELLAAERDIKPASK